MVGDLLQMNEILNLSSLSHTWILDLDGTLVVHNGYKVGKDSFLPGALEFLLSIPAEDWVIILTAREEEARQRTELFLLENGVRYNAIFFGVPMGERILINDKKPSGLICAHALNPERNEGYASSVFKIDSAL